MTGAYKARTIMVCAADGFFCSDVCWIMVCTGGGLSSSAAIVCSSSLAIAAALGLTSSLTKGAVAEFTCTAERYVGVTSGGMDQAISVMGMPGVALLVEFNPVSYRNACPAAIHCQNARFAV